jgi:hypothetical protein
MEFIYGVSKLSADIQRHNSLALLEVIKFPNEPKHLYNNCVAAKLGTASTGKFYNLEKIRMQGLYKRLEK